MKSVSKPKISPLNTVLTWTMIIALVMFLYLSYDYFAHAETEKHIGIEFSDTCKRLISLGDLDTCGNPEMIKSLYPPVSVSNVLQKQFNDALKNNVTEITNREVLNNHVFSCIQRNYCDAFDKYSNVIFWYDYDEKSRKYLDNVIVITPNMLHKNINKDIDPIAHSDGKRIISFEINQLAFKGCNEVLYSPERLLYELGYVIWYVSNDCDDIEKLGSLATPFSQNLEVTDYDPRDSPNWVYLQELEALKSKYKQNMLGKD